MAGHECDCDAENYFNEFDERSVFILSRARQILSPFASAFKNLTCKFDILLARMASEIDLNKKY